ncbi:MBOAT-domain-containing protein [Gonapodya prolifera JEL478]|uniref:MBOAT-domain-containing protein n=1 Tax=Gonapodya prolifera (strain JEL478) TaxID=1344416 RepID=A0A139A7E6_GONPJ|nr:MBOAT-domain-containing protein [Gonapodya prolifera JEL478]|eukprot:KXS12727.1 MBOAT-domain-containing protein [Gonapodya prolifera JEL478]
MAGKLPLLLSDAFGIPSDGLTLVISIVAAYPVAVIARWLPKGSRLVQELYSVVTTVAILVSCFGWTYYLNYLAATVYSYSISRAFRGQKWAPILVHCTALLHLSYYHLQNQVFGKLEDFENNDVTAPFMVLTIRMSSYAWSLYDGTRSPDSLPSSLASRAIVSQPSLLSYMGYTHFFCGLITGPAFDYNVVEKFVTGQRASASERLPNCFVWIQFVPPRVSILRPLLESIAVLAGYAIGHFALGSFSFHHCLTAEFKSWNLASKFLYVYVAGFAHRLKYYLGWQLSEVVCTISGISFNGIDKDGKPLWDRAVQLRFLDLELATNPRDYIDSWNVHTAMWLKNFVYLRFTKRVVDKETGKSVEVPSNFANLATFVSSAFWHGFFLGYYVFFVSGFPLTLFAKSVRRAFRPFFLPPSPFARFKPQYDALTFVATHLCLNYLAVSYILLQYEKIFVAYSAMYFAWHIGLIGGLLVLKGLGVEQAMVALQRKMGLLKVRKGEMNDGEGSNKTD